MPTISVADPMTLSRRLPEPAVEVAERAVAGVTTAPRGMEGEGFPVRRAFAGVAQEHLDPFIHLAHLVEVEYAPGEPKGTPWHPHRGFETVTYMIDGTFVHRDSNGDTQWMTAGSGILHIEQPPEELVASGGLFHGFQLWVNLPSRDKFIAPRYQDLRGDRVALLTSPDGGALIRVIAGEVGGHRGPGQTHTPITMLHITLQRGARLHLPWRADFNALAYVLSGSGSVGLAGTRAATGQLVRFGPGGAITIAADEAQESRSPNLDVLVLGGQPIGNRLRGTGRSS